MAIRVLIADDHAVVRDGLRAILDAQVDIEVVGDAANGRDAVDRSRDVHPQVVVMDITMPEMNGIEATREICAQRPPGRVIILSMHASPEHISRAFEAGARGYLLKESAGAEVVRAVRAVAAGERYLSSRIAETVLDKWLESGDRLPDPLAALSPREREVLQLVAEGRTSAQIADQLSLSAKTVDTYRGRIMDKLDIHDVAGLVRFAIQQGMTPLD